MPKTNEKSEEDDRTAPVGSRQTNNSPKMNRSEEYQRTAMAWSRGQTTQNSKMNEKSKEDQRTAMAGSRGQTAQNSKMNKKSKEDERTAMAGSRGQTTQNSKMDKKSKEDERTAMAVSGKQTIHNSKMNERSKENEGSAMAGSGNQTTQNSKMNERSEQDERTAMAGSRNQTTHNSIMNERSEEDERTAMAGSGKQTPNNSKMNERSEEDERPAVSGTQKQTTNNSKMDEKSKEDDRTVMAGSRGTTHNPKMNERSEEEERPAMAGTQNQTTHNPKMNESSEEDEGRTMAETQKQTTDNPQMNENSEGEARTAMAKSRRTTRNPKMNERSEEDERPAMGGTEKQTAHNPNVNFRSKEDERTAMVGAQNHATQNPKMNEKTEEDERTAMAGTLKQNERSEADQRITMASSRRTTRNPKMNERSENDERPATAPQTHTIHNQKMNERLEEDDRTALSGMTDSPQNRKPHSYSHRLRTSTGTQHKRQHQLRKHSLDENRIMHNHQASKNSVYFGGTPDSSDDEEFYPYSTVSANYGGAIGSVSDHHVDYRIGLDVGDECQKLPQQPMPEFMGSGGEVEIFKVPNRAPVNPNRPPCLELRPHPLRETQVGKFLRTIASTETQLWAGQESGVRVWNYSDSYKPGTGVGGRARRGDEDAAPFYESTGTSPTICMVVDQGSKLVWSGHKDGKIRSWKMDQHFSDENGLKEGLSWQAHKGPVLSIEISAYGDIWSGSENGAIRLWPWEAVEKSLSLSPEEKHMASLLVERSFIDLKNQVMVNGVSSIPSSDVKCMLSDNARGKIWAVGSLFFSMWDARTRELIKVFNIEGQTENRGDTSSSSSSSQDQVVEDEMNVKFVPKSKKEKPQGFLQRSRNAIMGAADAVRRVATKGAFAEDGKRTEAIMFAADGNIWSGCSNGTLIQWDGNGNRLQDFTHHPCGVLCLCSYGSRMWVGYVSGMVQLLDLEGTVIAGWISHNGPVIKLVVGNGFVFSLATHGGIRGWNISSPAPVDGILRSELSEREIMYTRLENVRILVGTWNVGQGRASQEALMSWLASTLSDVGIVVVGLQEVEMGAGFLAMSAAKETVGLEGSATGQWWQDHIGKALDEGNTFERVGSRQLAGLMIAIWVRNTLRTHVGDLDVAAVACGLGRAIGNKGGVGLRLRVFDRIVCFVNSHLAAHLEAVNRRNADFDHIYRTMTFSRSSNLLNNATAGVSSAAQMLRVPNGTQNNPDEGKPDLAEADMVVFLGDFNYRLFGISYDEARDFVSQRSFDWLREKDQLRAEMKAGKVFQGMREALIRFPPTYKFERGKPGLGGYDSGEKKRIPAWCDRVLYRDNRATPSDECSLECPMVASILQYEARMDVTESDHKPVRCKFNVDIAHVDRSVRRQEFGKILETNETIRSNLEALRFVPETNVNTNRIVLQTQETVNFKITNRSGKDMVIYQIVCEGQTTINEDKAESDYRPRGSLGFPRWLEVSPAAGVINPDQAADISVHHEEFNTNEESLKSVPQSWWYEDTRDKEVILLVNVRGSCSADTKTHRIHVRHCYSGNRASTDQKANNTPTNKTDTKANSSSSSKNIDSKANSGSKKYSSNSHHGKNS